MAECYFKNILAETCPDQDWQISSAGTWAQDALGATPEAIQAASLHGLCLENHRSRPITEEMLNSANIVITMDSGHKEAILNEFPLSAGCVYTLTEICGLPAYDIPDPYMTIENPKSVAEEIEALLRKHQHAIIDRANQH